MSIEIDMDKISELKSPIINGKKVTFIYRGQAETIFIAGDYNQWELKDKMKKIENRDLWYITKQFPENARFDYKFIVDGNWITDPLNENITPGGAGNNSTLIMPKYRSEYEQIISESMPRGNLIDNLNYYSDYLNTQMKYHIYLPFEYEKNKINNILYVLDGSDYVNFSKINLVLDYMIHKGEIPRLVAVLADPHERTKEYTIYKPYYEYITKELMPAVENRYMNYGDSFDRSVIGVSWGGLTSIYLAVNAPGKFNRVLSQSGSFWPKDWQIFDIIKEAVTPQIKFCLQTGTIQDTEEMNDAMFNLLEIKGYPVDYVKYAESHSWGNWKGHLNEGLRELYLD